MANRTKWRDREYKPYTPSVFEWVLAAMGVAGLGTGASMLKEGNSAGGVTALVIGAALIVAFVIIALVKRRRQ